ncbi:MAG: hypothetical protein FWF56_03520 [Firmicutes bacterium]|nr:hypothetical protein [Bacillota bacterium]
MALKDEFKAGKRFGNQNGDWQNPTFQDMNEIVETVIDTENAVDEMTVNATASTQVSVTVSNNEQGGKHLEFGLPQGEPGYDGKDGMAATIQVGTTATGQAGSNALVSNSGDNTSAVLDFVIPRGAGILDTSVWYQVGSDGTTPPTGTWEQTIPSVSQGQYLWTRTTIQFESNEIPASHSYSVAGQGEKGQDGKNGTNQSGQRVNSLPQNGGFVNLLDYINGNTPLFVYNLWNITGIFRICRDNLISGNQPGINIENWIKVEIGWYDVVGRHFVIVTHKDGTLELFELWTGGLHCYTDTAAPIYIVA